MSERNASARENHPLSPRRVSPFLAWDDFHAHSRFARSTIPEENWGTTRSLLKYATPDLPNRRAKVCDVTKLGANDV